MKRNILFICSLIFGFSASLWANGESEFEDSKVITRSVQATPDFELEISNKHGDVIFETWDKDSVTVTVTIEAVSQKLERVHSILENVDVRFTGSSDYLAMSTEWKSSSQSFKNDVQGLFGEQSVSINYVIKMPRYIEVEVDNKFGNVIMGDIDGKLKLDVSHGNISLRKVKNAKSIKLQYGNFKAKELTKCDLIARFSDVVIDEAVSLNLDCTSSEVEIEKVDKLVLKSVSDEIEIEEAGELNFGSSFSDIEIEKLTKSIAGTAKFGSLEIEEVESSFRDVTLEGQNTDIEIFFASKVAYSYFVQLEKGKSFIIPSDGNTLEKDNTFDDTHQFEGMFATIPVGGKPATVRIISRSSYIQFGVTD